MCSMCCIYVGVSFYVCWRFIYPCTSSVFITIHEFDAIVWKSFEFLSFFFFFVLLSLKKKYAFKTLITREVNQMSKNDKACNDTQPLTSKRPFLGPTNCYNSRPLSGGLNHPLPTRKRNYILILHRLVNHITSSRRAKQ